jgi:uncharacterized membrane protein (DUF485 family)
MYFYGRAGMMKKRGWSCVEEVVSKAEMNWLAIDADPRFQLLQRKKLSLLWGLMAFSAVYYFLLPVGAAYYQELFKIKVWGPVNVGILFALSEFVVAWTIAGVYAKRANKTFDAMAAEIIKDAHNIK